MSFEKHTLVSIFLIDIQLSSTISITITYEQISISQKQISQLSDAEGELTLSTGDYLLVWGGGDPQGGYYDAELLDGRRGLVPASFVQRLIGKFSINKFIKNM